MQRSTIFNGKTHYFDWAIFTSYVKLPEGGIPIACHGHEPYSHESLHMISQQVPLHSVETAIHSCISPWSFHVISMLLVKHISIHHDTPGFFMVNSRVLAPQESEEEDASESDDDEDAHLGLVWPWPFRMGIASGKQTWRAGTWP